MNPKFHLQTYQATCQGCSTKIKVHGLGDTPEAAELKAHEALEAENWTDGLCPDCAENKFLTRSLTEAERNEAAALLDAVKHCWSDMPADLAFNDLLMRRTAPKDWTPKNLELAKQANHHINEQ